MMLQGLKYSGAAFRLPFPLLLLSQAVLLLLLAPAPAAASNPWRPSMAASAAHVGAAVMARVSARSAACTSRPCGLLGW
jgi:hypothetical protein